MRTTIDGSYGTQKTPYFEYPVDRVIAVNWGSFAVLTVDVLATKKVPHPDEFSIVFQSFVSLTPAEGANVGPYNPGDAIPWTNDTWKGHSVASVEFSDQSLTPIEIIEQLPDKPAPAEPPAYEVCLDPGPTPSHDGIPFDGSGAAFYNDLLSFYSTAQTRVANVFAILWPPPGPGASYSTTSDITSILATGSVRADHSPGMPTLSIGLLNPPIPVQYTISYWGAPFAPPPTPGVTGTSAEAYVQWNEFGDALPSAWHVLTLGGELVPTPGDALVMMRLVFLIDFAQMYGDGHSEVVVSQGWTPLQDDFTGAYHNSYRLQIYNTSSFIAGPEQTVTVPTKPGPPGKPPVPVTVPKYDVTKNVLWNDGAEASHQVLHFNGKGFQ